MMQLVRYATAFTECLSANWTFGNQQPLGLGDMSEANGAIPGTANGAPGHPAGSHTNGYDMDIAYFQLGTPDNKLREVCEHEENGVDQFHCSGRVDTFDVWRTALFIGKLHDSDYMRVVGVDGKVGPLIENAVDTLCERGWLTGNACHGLRLAYDTREEQHNGWYYWHHHHLHVSGNDSPSLWSLPRLPTPPESREARSHFAIPCGRSGVESATSPFLYEPQRSRTPWYESPSK